MSNTHWLSLQGKWGYLHCNDKSLDSITQQPVHKAEHEPLSSQKFMFFPKTLQLYLNPKSLQHSKLGSSETLWWGLWWGMKGQPPRTGASQWVSLAMNSDSHQQMVGPCLPLGLPTLHSLSSLLQQTVRCISRKQDVWFYCHCHLFSTCEQGQKTRFQLTPVPTP